MYFIYFINSTKLEDQFYQNLSIVRLDFWNLDKWFAWNLYYEIKPINMLYKKRMPNILTFSRVKYKNICYISNFQYKFPSWSKLTKRPSQPLHIQTSGNKHCFFSHQPWMSLTPPKTLLTLFIDLGISATNHKRVKFNSQ